MKLSSLAFPFVASLAASGLVWYGVTPSRDSSSVLETSVATDSVSARGQPVGPIEVSPEGQAPTLVKFDPSDNTLSAGTPLTCTAYVNGSSVGTCAMSYQPNTVFVPAVNAVCWIIPSSFEYWTGTLGGRTVTLVRACNHPVNQPTHPASWYVATSGQSITRVKSGVYCSQDARGLVADVSLDGWRSVYGRGKIELGFN